MLCVLELPVRDVGLPCLVREVCFEADQAAAWSLLWLGTINPSRLRIRQIVALEGTFSICLGEVVGDRCRASIVAFSVQLGA